VRARCASIGWIRVGCATSEWCLRHRAVDRLPPEVDADRGVELGQACGPKAFECARALPLLKAVVHGRGGSEAARQGVPLDVGGEHVEDSSKHLTGRFAWPASAWHVGQERRGGLPELVARQKASVNGMFERCGVGGHGADREVEVSSS
jgi:hypothetical protein